MTLCLRARRRVHILTQSVLDRSQHGAPVARSLQPLT
jgi:hypothetical protein